MNSRTFAAVRILGLAPARSRPTNLPSLTAKRPNVVSAILPVAKKASMSARSCAGLSSMHGNLVGGVPYVNDKCVMHRICCFTRNLRA
jgi:hypothetical protein